MPQSLPQAAHDAGSLPSESAPSLREARRREKISQAEWRRRRAEVARLVAAGEEAAARSLLAEAGLSIADLAAVTQAASEHSRDDAARPAAADVRRVNQASPMRAAAKAKAKAGRSKASEAKQTEPQSGSQPTSNKSPKRAGDEGPATSPLRLPAATRSKKRADSSTEVRPTATRFRKKVRRQPVATWAEWFRQRPPWLTSLVTHGVLLTLFGLLSFATFGEPGFSLTAALAEDEAWDDLAAEVTLTDLDLEADDDFAEPIESVIDLTSTVELASLVEPVEITTPTDAGDPLMVSAEALMAAAPAAGGATESGEGDAAQSKGSPRSGAAGKVRFFGAESEAERVVFVVDNSGSMQQGRMETTLLELDKAVSRLSQTQEFYVVFFSDQAYPMFFPEVAMEPLMATRENKQLLTRWLHTVEMCVGGRILDAMDIATGLEPDVVYLLTDGDIRSEYVAGRMTAEGAWPFVINTLGMGARTPQHLKILHTVAANTGGVFRQVGPNPAAVARSRRRPIRYHREAGPVWGSAVKAWK